MKHIPRNPADGVPRASDISFLVHSVVRIYRGPVDLVG